MRKGTASVALGLLAMAAGTASAQVTFTSTWQKLSDKSVNSPRVMAWDPVSNEMILPESAGSYIVHTFDGTNGNALANMSTSGITLGSLGYFAIGASSSGKVYGYNSQTGGLTIWNSVGDAAPTEVTWSGLFSRNFYVSGTRIYAVGSADGGPITINDPAVAPATGYVLTEKVGDRASTGSPGGKAGVTANAAGTLLFGTEAISGPPDDGIHMWTKSGGTWAYQGDLLFPTQFPAPANPVGTPYTMDVALDEVHNLLFGIELTYNKIFAIDLGNPMVLGDEKYVGEYTVNSDLTYYGSLAVDPVNQNLYWMGRNTDTSASFGVLRYVVPEPASLGVLGLALVAGLRRRRG